MNYWPIAVTIAVAVVGLSCRRDDEPASAELPEQPEYTWVNLSETQPDSATAPPAGRASLSQTADSQPSKPEVKAGAASSAAQVADPTVEVPAFTPLADAAPGEWVRYAAPDECVLEYRVLSVERSKVTTQIQLYQWGHPLGQPATRVDVTDRDPLAERARRVQATRSARQITVEAAGRTWNATCYEDRWIDEEIPYVRRTWVSEKVPVLGTIRMELHGDGVLEANLELVAFGDK